MVARVLMHVWSASTPNRTMSITTRRTALLLEIELYMTVTVEPVMYAPPPWVASGGHTSEGGLCVDATMSDLRCLCQLKCHANTRLCTHGSVVRKWFVKVSRPASVYLQPVRDKPKSNMCINPGRSCRCRPHQCTTARRPCAYVVERGHRVGGRVGSVHERVGGRCYGVT